MTAPPARRARLTRERLAIWLNGAALLVQAFGFFLLFRLVLKLTGQ